jgi:hypothetical protein
LNFFPDNTRETCFFFTKSGMLTTKMTSKILHHMQILCNVALHWICKNQLQKILCWRSKGLRNKKHIFHPGKTVITAYSTQKYTFFNNTIIINNYNYCNSFHILHSFKYHMRRNYLTKPSSIILWLLSSFMGSHVRKWVSNLPETVTSHITVRGHNLNKREVCGVFQFQGLLKKAIHFLKNSDMMKVF